MTVPNDYVALRGSERTPMANARPTGTIDPNEQIQVTVYVRPKNPFAMDVTGTREATSSTLPLTRDEYLALHGADRADLEKVEEFARSRNLEVLEASEAQRSVKLAGRAEDFAAAFAVELQRYEHPEGVYRGRTGPVHIPQALDGIVEGVFGLDNRPAAVPHVGLLQAPEVGELPAADASAGSAPMAGSTLSAPQVAALYSFPPLATGAGQTIGIIELGGGVNTSDLAPYFKGLGLQQPTVTTLSVDKATSNPNQNDGSMTLEVMLDIEVAGAVAPGAAIVVYFAPNTDQSFINAVNAAIHDTQNAVTVISISWGHSEDLWTASSRQTMDQAFQAANLLGMTVCVASGDKGSSDGVSDAKAHVDFPASSPNALACGGTSLTSSGTTITSEVAWNNAANQTTGGGISDAFAVPNYQNNANLPASANAGAGTGRGVPDVSGHAAAYSIYFYGNTITAWGTSAVAPLWAGLTALLNQTLATSAGSLNPTIYTSPAALRDITNGNNGAYTATTGWDACTGLGSPVGTSLVAVLRPPPRSRGCRNFIQSDWGARGNFELLVPAGNVIRQYFRNNDDPALGWHFLREFGYPASTPVQPVLAPTPRSVTFLQSNFKGDGVHGNFEAVVRAAAALPEHPDHLDFWWLDSKTSTWHGPSPVIADGTPISGVTGD